MLDIYTADLLIATEDALCPAPNFTPQQLGEWHSHTLRNRLPLIREALRIACEEGDSELATQLIDQAVADHPTTASTAPIPRPVLAQSSANYELPIPERVLCALLHRHWAMTVEGKPPHETYVAHRPIGWVGEGNPYERITAPTRTELLRLLAHRHLGTTGNKEPDAPKPHTT